MSDVGIGTERRVGFFEAVWRFITFYKLRKTLGIVRAADAQFTGSAEGISDAYDLQHDTLVTQYKSLRDAIAQTEMVAEQRRGRLEQLNERERTLLEMRDGALRKAEAADSKSDEYVKHQQAFVRFQEQIDAIEKEQGEIEDQLGNVTGSMKKYMTRLKEMQLAIDRLPEEKANEIAKFISSKQIIELNDRLANLNTSMDRGPIEAVRKANAELTAKARISDKLAGTDTKMEEAEYQEEGKASAANDTFEKMLAARKAERTAKTGGDVPVADKNKDVDNNGRPKI